MKILKQDENNVKRIVGIPVGSLWRPDPERTLQTFEPENPSLLTPGATGVGWDLNTGAIAAKLGLIRPDDSLPDMEQYIPKGYRRALRYLPFAGLGVIGLLAKSVSRHEHVASNWSASGYPKTYGSGKLAAGTLLAVGAIPLLVMRLARETSGNSLSDYSISGRLAKAKRRAASSESPAATESTAGGSVSASVIAGANAVGVQTLAVLAGAAILRERKSRGKRQPLILLAPISFPLVTLGILIAVVKSTLSSINKSLRRQRQKR